MKDKTVITISRLWHNPEIRTVLSKQGISLEMDIEDFKTALLKEIGSVMTVFRRSTFEAIVDKAFENIIEGIKEESIKVVD